MSVDTPVSIWRKTSGNDERSYDGPNDIDDPLANLLVDTVGNNIVDTGITMTVTPQTEWAEDNSV